MANSGFVDILSPKAESDVKGMIEHLKQIKSLVDGINAKKIVLPSQAKTASNSSASVVDNSNTVRQKTISLIERERLAELKLQQDRERAFAKYDAQQAKKQALADKIALKAQQDIQKQINLEAKASAQALAEQKKREAQILKESNLRERLTLLQAKEPSNFNNREQERLSLRLANLKKEEAIQNAKLRVEISSLTNEQKKEAQAALGVLNSYQLLDRQLGELRLEAKGLAADMFNLEIAGQKNSTVYSELSNRYASVASRVTVLDRGLKQIDSNLGQSTRFVGNYERGWNGLGNAINQLTREAPAFALSISTGFLAISNNLPILVDEIAALNKENERLRAQGEPTKSVLKQIASALFSWQTLLSVGVTLLTLYGAKLIEWATNVKSATREIDQLNAATERYQNTIVETTTNSEKELTALNRKLAVAQDVTKSDKERAEAAKEIIEKYPGYLENLTKEQVMLGNSAKNNKEYSKALKSLTADIQARVEAEAKQSASRESLKIAAELEQEAALRQRVNDQAREYYSKYGDNSPAAKQAVDGLRTRIKARQELLKEDQEFISKFGELGVATTGAVDMLGLYTPSQITELKNRAQLLRNEVQKEQDEVNKIFKDTSLLDYNPDETSKKMQEEALADFLASDYAYRRTLLENEAAFHKEIAGNEENGYADREYSAQKYGKTLVKLAEIRLAEELRLIDYNIKEESKKLNKRVKDGEITQKNANAVIGSLEKQGYFDRKRVYEEFSQEIIDANAATVQSLEGVWENLSQQERDNKLALGEIENLRTINELYKSIGAETDLKGFADIENKLREIERQAEDTQIEALKGQRADIQGEIQKIKLKEKSQVNNEAINKLLGEQYAIDQKILGVENKRAKAIADLRKETRDFMAEYFKAFTDNSFNEYGFSSLIGLFDEVEYEIINSAGNIEKRVGSSLDKIIDQSQSAAKDIRKSADAALASGAITAEQYNEKMREANELDLKAFSASFNKMIDIARDFYNFIQQNNQARFDAEYENARRVYEINQKFAGESAAAKAELDREYEQKQREIRIREAKAAKETAIFNAVISTAQAVAAALPKIGLSILVGALGAAQIATIAARPLPQYAEGTDYHPGGGAIVGDGGKREVIKYPSGKMAITPSTPTLVDLPRGSQVYPDMMNAGVFVNRLPPVSSEGNGSELLDALNSINGKLSNVSTLSMSFDKSGFSSHVSKGHSRKVNHDNRISFKGRSIR